MSEIHHPSCPQRDYAGVEGPADRPACYCGPEAAAEDQLILSERTPDTMLLDIHAHANQAWNDFQHNTYGRRTPKGLLAAVLLDSDLPGERSQSWGVQA